MSQIITAPSIEKPIYTSIFLAGGITNCKDWQKEVIKELEFENISIFNPRQENFDITDKNASFKQISWEFERLEQMDIFSMYFCNSESDQPICMYELGRNSGYMNKISYDAFCDMLKGKTYKEYPIYNKQKYNPQNKQMQLERYK